VPIARLDLDRRTILERLALVIRAAIPEAQARIVSLVQTSIILSIFLPRHGRTGEPGPGRISLLNDPHCPPPHAGHRPRRLRASPIHRSGVVLAGRARPRRLDGRRRLHGSVMPRSR
jgi:hypothetical protein